ncbi:hypothetical protein [Jannaschia sp. CCS1]|uniref:hypothetical protein n=1 Tax=Jannaschia sp. (strain CCS1) TaxID=290400 RepID=UPI000053AEB8|nr:hypothetical protein [Jannaschia sp. CCS1]ABD54927.1 hypothetical protein Jann_2010 [Jannaschia sp. CCS1]
MNRSLSGFDPIPQHRGLWSAQKGTLRCTALQLRDGSLCLYSPVLGLGDAARTSLAKLGKVAFLLAPNHYHNKGLSEYAKAFAGAALVCSERARPRLEQQTGLSFEGLQPLNDLLPDGAKILEPQGLKTGEVWLTRVTSEDTVWVVCDAFKGPSGKEGDISTQIELLGTFPTYGIEDKGTYSAFVKSTLTDLPPTTIVPCHGSIVRSDHLAADIASLTG